MKTLALKSYSGPSGLQLDDAEISDLADGHVLVRVHSVGINYPDLLLTQGNYQLKPPLPVVPGCEIAGTVEQTYEGSGFSVGDRVAAFVWQGGYAEYTAVPANHLMRVPDSMSLIAAAATVVNYHTVLFALQRRAVMRPGESVLVLGAGGGIGTAALQVAQGLGASTVIAGVASTDQVDTALGALPSAKALVLEEGFAAAVRELTDGRGVDVVLDPVGDWIFDEAIRALAPEGRLAVIGFAAGSIPKVAVNRLLLRNIGIVGAAFGAFLGIDSSLMSAQSRTLADLIDAGAVNPHIGATFEFDEIPRALDELSRGRIRGKAVATVNVHDTQEDPQCAATR
ncbi:NADPH:quinone oxidoreductase family protein [Rhodococcus sp. NCIMB 12038]|uniref:NADPH:quinone oxidoreductase family protein n=1 Tax=Rhodococcus sp. NCIMB 12038 TaxID=933800 RepID=UPI000B3C9393|nr:NADPH:quinone oxidoreductase family protein [Rhodococcus sp. NCIMB 12038]OUS94281.1 hypothetical protein CA951_17875 [Rhodococcus sp. NCIMB 12038]